MKFSAKQIDALRRYQIESGSRELRSEKAMKEYESASKVYKTLKPFSNESKMKILNAVKALSGFTVR